MPFVQALGHAARAPVVRWPAAQAPWRWTREERRLKRTTSPHRQKNMWQKSGNWWRGATVGKEVQLLCPLGPARPVLFLTSKPNFFY